MSETVEKNKVEEFEEKYKATLDELREDFGAENVNVLPWEMGIVVTFSKVIGGQLHRYTAPFDRFYLEDTCLVGVESRLLFSGRRAHEWFDRAFLDNYVTRNARGSAAAG